ncbi:Methyltransferase domain-containing protein [Alkalibacterium thalassium]|uniref:Methyltransferase domain-containing protein n=2 Tax=Alkalibacterium thalassium TaxID=426701 RepID=A0A1G8ZEG6_9LACT|nr:Methyltransferase domain-containing protein [Alkalibacterium thalassium]
MLDPLDYLSQEEEKERYKNHNNDVNDPRYQKFVSPIVEKVRDHYDTNHLGLDYGAGTGPVITSLLEKEGYALRLYDPFFHLYPKKLSIKYDYIICSEVIEHFHHPYEEFKSLAEMLKPKGSIFCLTSLYNEEIDFETWYYKNDDTHVFFYHKKALEWIRNKFDFSDFFIDGKLIKLTK